MPPAEIVVVDDGSPEDLRAALGDLLSDPVCYVRRPNGGPAAARNTGIRSTTAPLVAFLDADDVWYRDKLQRQLQVFEQQPDTVAVCSDARVTRDGSVGLEAGDGERLFDGRQVPAVLEPSRLLAGNPVGALTVVARRVAIERTGGFDEDPALIAVEDYDLWLRLAELGPFRVLHEPLACYRRTPSSLGNARRFLGGVERVFEKVLARHPLRAEDRRVIQRRRGELRRAVAWEALVAGDFTAARRAARVSLGFDPWWGAGLRLWLRGQLHPAP
jgi:glycosyltransferase involved in cell wall biosynthesis